jgi:hypothetical protein
MQPPAIQAALDNLVETVRTSLMAEFLELLRDGKPAVIKRKASAKKKKTKKAIPRARASKTAR